MPVVLLAMLLFSRAWSNRGTEFGAVADLPFPEKTIQSKLIPEWNRGGLAWVRTSSPILTRHGLNQVAILHWAPAWSQSAGGKDLPDDLLALYWHCRTNSPVYASVRQAWEIWNEPDFYFVRDNPDRMAAVLKAAYWGLKAANPKAIVLMPSLAFTPEKYPNELWRNDAFAYTEGYNFHFYGWAQDFEATIRQHQSFLARHGLALPLWITEAGYFDLLQIDAENPLELARQRTFHERMAVNAQAAGIEVYLPFILTPYTEAGSDLSLVRRDLSPRPALNSYLALSRELPGWKPLFRLWHRPSQSVIGEVFQGRDGSWQTVLWTPIRWREVVLPPLKPDAEPNADRSDGTDPTTLSLHLRLSPANRPVQVNVFPLSPEVDPGPHSASAGLDLELTVSSTNNVFLRTAPTRFEISDCEWRPVANSPSPRGRSASSAFAGESPSEARPIPSPVILQLTYDPVQARSDKPSQSYQFEPGHPVDARLSLYNLSEKEQHGTWTLNLPTDWLVTVLKHSGSLPPEAVRLPAAGSNPSATAELVLPGLSRREIALRFVPPASRAGSPIPVQPRALVQCRWTSDGGIEDHCASWLEPRPSVHPPNLPFTADQWVSTLTPSNQWEIVRLDHGEVHLLLQGAPAPGRLASIWCVLPDGLELRSNDVLRAEIRTASARPLSYRLNLLTENKEAFRYTEDVRLTEGWNRLSFRIGDFGPTLWSEPGPDYELPITKLRFVRLSFNHAEAGDFLELRNCGIWRPASSEAGP